MKGNDLGEVRALLLLLADPDGGRRLLTGGYWFSRDWVNTVAEMALERLPHGGDPYAAEQFIAAHFRDIPAS